MLEAILTTVIVTVPPSALAALAWKQSRVNGKQTATNNGSTIAEYVMRVDGKVDRVIAEQRRVRRALVDADIPVPPANE